MPSHAEEHQERPSWDSSQFGIHRWLSALETWLATKNADYVSLWTSGSTMSRYTTVVASEFSGVLLRDGILTKGTFKQPTSLDIFIDFELAPGMAPLATGPGNNYAISSDAVRRVDRQLCFDVLSTIESHTEVGHF